MSIPKDIRLLVADTNANMRQLLKLNLAKQGFAEVVVAEDIRAVGVALKTGAFGFLVLDWEIASFKEFVLLKKLRGAARYAKTPILVTSPGDGDERRAQAGAAGADGLLVKPFNVKTLLEAMESALGARQAPTAKPESKPKAAPSAAQEAAARIDPEAKKLFQSGYAKLKSKNFDEALADFEEAFKVDDLFADAYKGAAFAAKGRGDGDGSLRYMGKAAESYAMGGRMEEAASVYTNLRKVSPDAPNPFKAAGRRLKEAGRLADAAGVMEKGFEFSPTDDELAAELAFTYKEQGEDQKAEDFLKELLGGDGEFPLAAETFIKLTGEDFYSTGMAVESAPTMQFQDEAKMPAPGGGNQRGAARIPMFDYSARLRKTKALLSVLDVSTTGIGFKPMDTNYKAGDEVFFDLVALGEDRIKKLTAKVMRVTPNVVGCQFVKLSKKQAKILKQLFGEDEKK